MYFVEHSMLRFFNSFYFFSLFLVSCSQESWEKKALEIESVAKEIYLELKEVDTKEILLQKQDRLKSLFSLFASLLCQADATRRKKGYNGNFSLKLYYCKNLQSQVDRVSLVVGCKEILEICQRDALHFLDAYDRKHQRQDPFSLFERKGNRVLR